VATAEAYLHAKFHLDPSNRLDTVQKRHRQTGQDRQRTDSIGRTVFGRPFVKRFGVCYRSVVCLSVLFVCLSVTLVYCGQKVGRIKMKLGMQVSLGPGHIVLDEDPGNPPPKGHSPIPIFGPYLLWPNSWLD